MKVVTRYKFQLPFCIVETVYGNMVKVGTVWRIIFVESLKRPSKLIFVVLNFVAATSPGAWHCCTSDNVFVTRAHNLVCLLSHTYRDLD